MNAKLYRLIFFLGTCLILCACKNESKAQEHNTSTEISESKKTNQHISGQQIQQKSASTNAGNVAPSSSKTNSGSKTGGMDDYLKKQKEIQNLSDIYPYNLELKDADGTIHKTEDVLKTGKPTVLLFWLTTCGPCQMELREITKKYSSWQEEADFNFYAISTDFEKNYERFSKQVKEKNYAWPTFNDVYRKFRFIMPGGLNGLPQTFLLDKNGEIVYHKRKYRLGDEDTLFEKVKSLL